MSEVQGYAIRITQNNDLEKVMTQKVVDLIKKHNGAVLSQDAQTMQERIKYLATLIFLKKEKAEGFFKECADIGIEVYWEKKQPIVDDKYFK